MILCCLRGLRVLKIFPKIFPNTRHDRSRNLRRMRGLGAYARVGQFCCDEEGSEVEDLDSGAPSAPAPDWGLFQGRFGCEKKGRMDCVPLEGGGVLRRTLSFLDEKDSAGAGNLLGERAVLADSKFQKASPLVGI
jgi:hypothetical protein